MKKRFVVFAAYAGLLISMLTAAPVIERADLVAICGDSITARRIYSLYLEEYLLLCSPIEDVGTVQVGRGFDTAEGFVQRLDNDVLPFEPTVATLCFGMNDGKYAPLSPTTLNAYRNSLTEAVRRLKTARVRTIVIGSPGVVDPAKFNQTRVDAAGYNETLSRLRDTANEVAQNEGVLFADVHTPMLTAMNKAKARFGAGYQIAGDGIHPHANGHLVIAYAFLKALGFEGDIGTLSVDYVSGIAAGSPGQKVLSYADGILKIESTRYPFCFEQPEERTGSRALTAFIPFNHELNRYRLVVKNAPARTRVTWGTARREFSASELAAGINLADVFPDNPFCKPFFAAAKAMKEQQDFEDQGIRVLLNSQLEWRKEFPAAIPQIDALATRVVAKAAEKRAASRAAIQPVRHEIKLEPID